MLGWGCCNPRVTAQIYEEKLKFIAMLYCMLHGKKAKNSVFQNILPMFCPFALLSVSSVIYLHFLKLPEQQDIAHPCLFGNL